MYFFYYVGQMPSDKVPSANTPNRFRTGNGCNDFVCAAAGASVPLAPLVPCPSRVPVLGPPRVCRVVCVGRGWFRGRGRARLSGPWPRWSLFVVPWCPARAVGPLAAGYPIETPRGARPLWEKSPLALATICVRSYRQQDITSL